MFALNTSREVHFHRIDNTDVLRDGFFGNLDAWRACDLIFTCGDFANRVRRRFPGAAVVSVSDADEYWNLAPSFLGRRVQTIGVISTGLLDFVISEPKAMRFLCQLCEQKLLLWTKFQEPGCRALRSSLHTAGFYEVVSEEGDNESSRFDFSSVSCHPMGVHELESRSLGFRSPSVPYRTIAAFRCAIDSHVIYPWCYPLGTPPVESEDGVVAVDRDAIVLSLRSTNAMMDARGSLVIHSTLSWRSTSPTGSFVALVGSHHGVADDGMILLMLEAYSEEVAYISLWESDEQWIRVMNMRIPIATEHTASGPRYFVKLGMEISQTFVDVDLDSRPLLRMYRDGIQLTNRFGIRMRGSQFVVESLEGTIQQHE
jgi:hypothetical protein